MLPNLNDRYHQRPQTRSERQDDPVSRQHVMTDTLKVTEPDESPDITPLDYHLFAALGYHMIGIHRTTAI